MRLVITGSSGFIGTHLVSVLADRGHEIVGFDLNPPQVEKGLANFERGDIRNDADVDRAFAGGADCVINLAAKHYDWGITEEEYFDYNVNGSRCLLKGMERAGIRKYLFYSTIAVYGEDLTSPCDESTEPRPNLPYGRSKLDAEELAVVWQKDAADRSVTIVRPCVVYGPRNFTNTFNLMRQIDSGLFVRMGTGSTTKAMCYVGNLIEATSLLLERMDSGIDVYNYTDSPDVEVRYVIDTISDVLGKDRRAPKVPMWLALSGGYVFDIAARITGRNFGVSSARIRKLEVPILIDAEKIRAAGFSQPFTFEQGIRDMAEWYVKNFRGNPDPPVNPPY